MDKNQNLEIITVPNSILNLGEGPFWDIEKQSLFYVDIYDGTILRYDFKEAKIYKCKIVNETQVSFVIPVNNSPNEFIIGANRKIALIEWDGIQSSTEVKNILAGVEDDKPNNRFNDAKCDPKGRLFAGTMRLEILPGDVFKFREGSLYKLTNDMKIKKILNNVGISNGLDWNNDLKKFYYIDSVKMNIVEFNYNPETGDIDPNHQRQIIKYTEKNDFVLDGMTLDAKGDIYVTQHGTGKLSVINPQTGKINFEIHFPSKLITSCAFGGPNLDILFVTSAHKGKEKSPAGSLYIVKGLQTKGLPMAKFNLH